MPHFPPFETIEAQMNTKYILALVLTLLLASCNIENERKPTESEVFELQKRHNDSISVVLDSMFKVSISVPPLFDSMFVDASTVNQFFELAAATDGELKILVNSELIANEIKYIIEKHSVDNADILFLIDKTSSMEDDIANVRKGLTEIINSISKYKNVRVAIGLYGDKNYDGKEWYSFRNFDTDLKSAKNFIKGIQVTAGMDYPESVYDGFFETTKENFWKSENKRMIILIGDAPPLEKPLSEYSMDDVIAKATADKITMNFYPIVVSSSFMEYVTEVKSYEATTLVTSFYPNPTSGNLTINLEKDGNYDMQVFDSKGIRILSEKHNGKSISKEVHDWPNGTYMIRIIDSEMKFETIKLVVYK
jgi:hypothetical protein